MIRRILATLLLAFVASTSYAQAQSYATTPAVANDVTPTLGTLPYFRNGLETQASPTYAVVPDATLVTPAPAGDLMVNTAYPTSTVASQWQQSFIPYQLLLPGSYGVVTAAATSVYNGVNSPLQANYATVQTRGVVNAYCVTNATTAIAVGTPLVADGAGHLTTLPIPSTPATPTVTPVGTTGAVTVTYGVVAISYDGVPSAISTAGSTSSSNATGTNANYNQISWAPNGDAAYYEIVRVTATGYTPSTVGVIGMVPGNVQTFNDTGLAILANTSATQFFQRPAAGGTPTVVQVSGATAGSTTDSYEVTAIFPNGVWGTQGSAGTLSTANAVLSATNANKLTWTATTGAVMYAITRTAAGGTPSTTGLIGYAPASAATSGYLDYGQAAVTYPASPQVVPNPFPRVGEVLGYSLGTLATSTSTPTLVSVLLTGGGL